MKNFNKTLLKLSLLIGINTFGSVYAQFTSLHQLPKVYNVSATVQTPPLIGFKDQFAPSGTPGCVMGYSELRSLCKTVEGGFGFILNGYTSFNEFKVYIPSSTTFFGLSGYLPQGEEYAVVARMETTPTRTIALTADEYRTIKSTQNINTAFNRLQAGEEMIFVHDGGGNISLSGTARLADNPVQTGKWLYIRVINGGALYNLTSVYEVNLEQYRAGYNSLAFGANGDPIDNGSTPNVPTLTSISLSRSTWNAATDANNTSITVKPTPVGATLPACTASPANMLTAGAASATEAVFTILPSAVTANTTVTISCGGKTANLTLQAVDPNAAQIKDSLPTEDDAGNLVLNFKLTRPATQVVSTNKTNFWVAARVRADGFFFTEDEWFFLTPNGWMQLSLPNPTSVAYQVNQAPAAEKSFSIPIDLPAADLGYFNADIHFGYMGVDGVFRNMGVVWQKTN